MQIKFPGQTAAIGAILAALGWIGGCSAPKDTAVIAQADQINTTLAPAEIQDDEVNAYLQQIGRRIQAAAQELDAEHVGPKGHFTEPTQWMYAPDIQFHLVNSTTLNAFTTGGHHVYVYNQLLQTCDSEEDLAAVMSHEFAHIYCRHVAEGDLRSQRLAAFSSGAGYVGQAAVGQQNGTAAAGMVAAAGNFVGMGYTRGDEGQADQYGFKIYTRAGWDPSKFGNFFQKMINLGYDTTPGMLSDHPTLASRVTAARQRSMQVTAQQMNQPLVPDIATQQQFEQIKAMAKADAAHTPTDAQLQTAQKLLNAFPSCVAPAEDTTQQQARNQVLQETNVKPLTPEQQQQAEQQSGN